MKPSQERTGSTEEYAALSLEQGRLLSRLGYLYNQQADALWADFVRALNAGTWAQTLVAAEKLWRLDRNKKAMKDLIYLYFKLEEADAPEVGQAEESSVRGPGQAESG